MAKVILFINPKKESAPVLAAEIRKELSRGGFETEFCGYGREAVPNGNDYALAFSLGGDGTVLFAARIAAARGIPIIPVNLGTLGFVAAVHPSEWKAVFEDWLEGKAPVSRRIMLEVTVERKGERVFTGVCLNEAVISASGIAKIIRLDVFAEKGGLELGRYLSDGLIVATPTGSTAYSVAAGGPILDPEMEALIVNPICPFTLSNRPVVLPAEEKLIVELEAEQRSGILLTVDGQITERLEAGDRLRAGKAPFHAEFVASGRAAFYRALRSKLNWSGGEPRASNLKTNVPGDGNA